MHLNSSGKRPKIKIRMPKHLRKSLQDYLYKLKKHTQQTIKQSPSFSSSKDWIKSGCKYPKTPSFSMRGDQNNTKTNSGADTRPNYGAAATLSDVDHFLFENFRSLYLKDDNDNDDSNNNINRNKQKESENSRGANSDSSPRGVLNGSHTFFATRASSGSPSEETRSSLRSVTTNSNTSDDGGFMPAYKRALNDRYHHDASSSSNTTVFSNDDDDGDDDEDDAVKLPGDCIAVPKYSASPYDDFRRSMQEMVEAKMQEINDTVDWPFMEELLFCYLNLNEKKSHKFIMTAFVDLLVDLRQSSHKLPTTSRNFRVARESQRRITMMRLHET